MLRLSAARSPEAALDGVAPVAAAVARARNARVRARRAAVGTTFAARAWTRRRSTVAAAAATPAAPTRVTWRDVESWLGAGEARLVAADLPAPRTKVVVGMSGGVDSSVSAMLLRARGCDVSGAWMRNWDDKDDDTGLCSAMAERDWEDAVRVGRRLGVPVRHVDLSRQYWNGVWAPCLDSYARGATPNPDVFCNREVKFGAFLALALREWSGDVLATGHYARVDRAAGLLLRGLDDSKDQSYFLCAVPSAALRRACFPVGSLRKTRVRELAARAGLDAVAAKPDSVGVCFVGERRRFSDFVAEYLPSVPGARFRAVDSGEDLGPVAPAWFVTATVGQGARIPGAARAWFVARKDPDARVVWVAPARHRSLLCSGLRVLRASAFWVHGARPASPFRAACQVRYRAPPAPATVAVDAANGDALVAFDAPVSDVAVGQVCAFYDAQRNEECWGGGVIGETFPVAAPTS